VDAFKDICVRNRLASQKALLRRVVPIFAFLLLFPGCSTYQNLTAYFNTYYNAQKLFDDGVAELTRVPPAGKDTNYFAPVLAKSDGQSKFDKVIEKCSKIIQFYPESKLVGDAIVLIGESYVYMGEYESAIRKFKELLDNFPASDRRAEVKLWYAKAQYYSEKEDDAIKLVEELVPEALDGGKNDIALEAVMLEAQIYFNRGEYQRSAEQYERAVTIPGPRSVRSIAQYQLGQSYQRNGDNKKAAAAYLNVKEFKPDFAMRTRSILHAGMMLVSIGEYDKALTLYRDLREEMYKPEEIGPVDMEIASAYLAMGDTTRAFPLFTKLDTTYRRTEIAAKGYYRQAAFYENNLKDFKTAFDMYSRVQGENSAAEVAAPAQKRADILARYFTLQSNLSLYDTLFIASLHRDTTSAVKDSSQTARDSTAYHAKSTLQIDSSLTKGAASALRTGEPNPRSLAARTGRPEKPFGVARHRSRGHDDFDDDIESDTWADSAASIMGQVENVSAYAKLMADLQSNKSRLQRMRLSTDSLRFLSIQSKFELGGLFMLDLGFPDSAAVWFEKVARDSVISAFIPRALYALAEIHSARGDSSIVDSLYRRILERYKESEYGREVRRLKGLGTVSENVDSAESRYTEAQRSLMDGRTDDALRSLKELSQKYPASPIAPKALYAVGWIYENVLVQNDSAASWYRRLIKAHPSSLYAVNVQPKVAVKDNPDSLSKFINVKEVEKIAIDSLPARSRARISGKVGKDQQVDQQERRRRGQEEGVEEDNKDEEKDQLDLQDQTEPPDTTTSDNDNNNNERNR
jgi:tetratricopeptide (TPR) repeat protein